METTPRSTPSLAPALDAVAEFQRANRCPLHRGRLNRWIVRRTLRGLPSNAQILDGIGVQFEKWFGREHAWGADVVATVRDLARRKALHLSAPVAATSDTLTPALSMLGDSFASIAVDFLYFGPANDMPWPVLDARGAWLPIDCIWACDLVAGIRAQ